jgi:hypothetical protein
MRELKRCVNGGRPDGCDKRAGRIEPPPDPGQYRCPLSDSEVGVLGSSTANDDPIHTMAGDEIDYFVEGLQVRRTMRIYWRNERSEGAGQMLVVIRGHKDENLSHAGRIVNKNET